MDHVLAMVDFNSNGFDCHNYFDSTREDFNHEDPGDVIRVVVANKKEDSQITYKDDSYEWIDYTDSVYQCIHDMRNREEFGQSITARMFLETTLFTGSEPIHSFGLY